MKQTISAESELSNFLNEVANQEKSTWNRQRTNDRLQSFVQKLLDKDQLDNISLV